jgi:hypothetical protein
LTGVGIDSSEIKAEQVAQGTVATIEKPGYN